MPPEHRRKSANRSSGQPVRLNPWSTRNWMGFPRCGPHLWSCAAPADIRDLLAGLPLVITPYLRVNRDRWMARHFFVLLVASALGIGTPLKALAQEAAPPVEHDPVKPETPARR